MKRDERRKYRLMVDFDGVIHKYVSPFTGLADINDPPVPGAIEWLTHMSKHFEIAIHSTRCEEPAAVDAMKAWLERHGLAEEVVERLRFTYVKLPALIYLDDRALRFDGTNWPTKEFVHAYRPWNKTQKRDDEERVQFWARNTEGE